MTVSEEQLQSLFVQLQKRMVDNGDWDKWDPNPCQARNFVLTRAHISQDSPDSHKRT